VRYEAKLWVHSKTALLKGIAKELREKPCSKDNLFMSEKV
jgi:hypothetical protein